MTALGLSPQAQTAYRVALAQSSWAPPELISRIAASSAQSVADATARVGELVALELLRPSTRDTPTRLRVVSPTVALESRLAQARREALAQQQALDAAAGQLSELQDRYTEARDAHVEHAVQRLTGLDAVRSRLEQLEKDTRWEALSFMRGGQTRESMEASGPLDEAALARGISLRNVYQHSAMNDATTAAYLRRLGALGAETRTVATLPLQLLVVDREIAVIPINPERTQLGALVIRSSGVLTALLALFESVWQAAKPLGGRRRTAATEQSDTDREILRILATGATDEVVARQLGVSVRTVRRLTSVMMSRHQAQSRFELGLKLGQAGWGPSGSMSP